jgi:hypothetical protein
MSWTRVKEVDAAVGQRISIWDVEADINLDKTLKQIRKGAVRDLGAIIFDPEFLKEQNE